MFTRIRTLTCLIALAAILASCGSTPQTANLPKEGTAERTPEPNSLAQPELQAQPESQPPESQSESDWQSKPQSEFQPSQPKSNPNSDGDAPPLFNPGESSRTDNEPPLFDPAEIFNPKPSAKPLPEYIPPELQEQSAHSVVKANRGGKPLCLERTKIKGIPLYKMIIDLDDPQTYITLGLPHNAVEANSAQVTHGDEEFTGYVKRYKAALCANGTFFSKDEEKRVMGNIVTEGQFRKYSQWETYGTTLGIKANNELEMVTARAEGQPDWSQYWFSVTCGPRLLRQGKVEVDPELEGFKDSHVFTIGPRSALGFNRKKRQIIYAAFLRGLSLEREAELMKALGCDEAMNLDGGASRAVATGENVVIKAGRPLTNVLVVYDTKHPAPKAVTASWTRFQEGERPTPP